MKTKVNTHKKTRLLIGALVATLVSASVTASAGSDPTFRALSYGVGVYQGKDAASKPTYVYQPIAGHDLVAAALGMQLGTVLTNQVLALNIDCSSTNASLVVFDKSISNSIATVATSTSLDIVQQQDKDTTAFPNRERFVGQFAIVRTNNLVSGYLTIAGRLRLNPTNGCPQSIRMDFDPKDRWFGDVDGRNLDDRKDHDILRAGLGHAVGVVDLIFNDGSTNTVLLPHEALSFRRQLD
jgi:hypothetical protein